MEGEFNILSRFVSPLFNVSVLLLIHSLLSNEIRFVFVLCRGFSFLNVS